MTLSTISVRVIPGTTTAGAVAGDELGSTMVCNGFAMSLGDKLLEMSRIIFTAEILGLDDSQENISSSPCAHMGWRHLSSNLPLTKSTKKNNTIQLQLRPVRFCEYLINKTGLLFQLLVHHSMYHEGYSGFTISWSALIASAFPRIDWTHCRCASRVFIIPVTHWPTSPCCLPPHAEDLLVPAL